MSSPPPDDTPFPAVTIDDWRAEAERVLKGKPPDTLTWRVEDGVEMPPVATDAGAGSPPIPVREGPVRSCAGVEDGEEARLALAAGVDVVRVAYFHDEQADDLDELPLERTLLEPLDSADVTAALEEVPGAAGVVVGGAGWAALLAGATPSQQVGWAVSAAVDVLSETEGVGDRVVVEVPVGAELLTEIAKLRAIRVLWSDVAAERDLPPRLQLLATCPSHPHTRLDAESNLLRATLAGFAAVCGGADLVEMLAYRGDVDAARLALNQLRLMHDESGLDAVADPLAGSGTIETLTAALVDRGRAELDRLRALGGVLAAEQAGDGDRVEQMVGPYLGPARDRDADLRHRRRVIVGTNRFADPSRDGAVLGDAEMTEYTESWLEPGAPLDEFAGEGDLAFEFLRTRMIWHESTGHVRPTVLLLPFGPEGWRRARADFAADLFRTGGFAIDDAGGLDSVDAAIERAGEAAVVVLCSDDRSCADAAPRVAAALPDTRVYVAGKPPDGADAWGVAGFVHHGMDALELLCRLQDELGVGRQP